MTTPIPDLPLDAQRFYMGRIRKGEVLALDDVEELEERSPTTARVLRGDGVRSILFVPLRAKDAPVGFIGFETRTRNTTWTEATVRRIRTVGELIVLAIDRARADAESKQAAAALEARNAELERSNRDLQQFASIVSHDLSQPLMVTQGFVEVLARIANDHPSRAAEAQAATAAALRGTARMRTLIDDVMAIARAGAPITDPVRMSLATVVAEVMIDLQALIDSTGGQISVGELPVVEGNPVQLRRLFQNVVANALKFHKPTAPSTVDISAVVDGDRCTITVADDGIGIEPSQRGAVFGMFSRGAQSEMSGLGIGLAVCARIVDNHGGRIWADGNESGGTSIVMELPLIHRASH